MSVDVVGIECSPQGRCDVQSKRHRSSVPLRLGLPRRSLGEGGCVVIVGPAATFAPRATVAREAGHSAGLKARLYLPSPAPNFFLIADWLRSRGISGFDQRAQGTHWKSSSGKPLGSCRGMSLWRLSGIARRSSNPSRTKSTRLFISSSERCIGVAKFPNSRHAPRVPRRGAPRRSNSRL